MSYQGQSPKVNRLRLNPRSSDPVNPVEGDLFYADGSDPARLEGLWIWRNSAWQTVLDGQAPVAEKLSLAPSATTPTNPSIGTLFMSDGTSRAAGLWIFTSLGWMRIAVQKTVLDFSFTTLPTARFAGTGVLANLYNGQSFGGGTLATNDIILVINASNTYQNGLYKVKASGAPDRVPEADTAVELSRALVAITSGTNAGLTYYQRNFLTNLTSDVQNWGTTPGSVDWTVPAGVFEIDAELIGGGGGGGSGGAGAGNFSSSYGGGGGGGGGGGIYRNTRLPVVPGLVFTITIGDGGTGGVGGGNGNPGTASSIIATNINIQAPGGRGGSGGTPGWVGGAGGGGQGGAGGSTGSSGNSAYSTSGGAGGAGGSGLSSYGGTTGIVNTGKGGNGGNGAPNSPASAYGVGLAGSTGTVIIVY